MPKGWSLYPGISIYETLYIETKTTKIISVPMKVIIFGFEIHLQRFGFSCFFVADSEFIGLIAICLDIKRIIVSARVKEKEKRNIISIIFEFSCDGFL